MLGNARVRDVKRCSASALDYMGGGSLYDGYGASRFFEQQIQQLGASQSFQSRKWTLSLRDTFRYLSEGSFGTSDLNSTALGSDARTPPTNSGSINVVGPPVVIGQDSFLLNNSGAEFRGASGRRSSFFAGGNYSLIKYFNAAQSLYDTRQASASGGYDYQMTSKDAIGVLYQYQNFRYPSGALDNISTHAVEFIYRRIFSRRISVSANAGPELTGLNNAEGQRTRRTGFTARATVTYKKEQSGIHVFYSHQVAGGSGLFAGVNEDFAGTVIDRSMHRHWNVSVNAGYTLGRQIGSTMPGQRLGSFAFVSGAGTVRRQLTRYLSAFGGYDFSGENFTNCAIALGCESVLRRNTVSFGLDWHCHPLSLR